MSTWGLLDLLNMILALILLAARVFTGNVFGLGVLDLCGGEFDVFLPFCCVLWCGIFLWGSFGIVLSRGGLEWVL